jgi:hypothetical protein
MNTKQLFFLGFVHVGGKQNVGLELHIYSLVSIPPRMEVLYRRTRVGQPGHKQMLF